MSRPREESTPSSLASRLAALPEGAVAVIIALVVVGIFLLLDPLADVPMNDDFSWARSALALAQTGKIAYNGWGNPILLPHIVAGAAVIRLFGFSHIALGAFGIVSGAAFAATAYLLARAVGVPRGLSLFVVGLLTLNPIFLGCTPSFMSDVPTSFLFIAAMLAFVHALGKPDDGKYRLHSGWLVAAVVLSFLAGANRQIFWAAAVLAFAVAVPSIAPRDRGYKLAPAIGAVLLSGAILSAWFSRQPYSIPVDFKAAAYFWSTTRELFFFFPFRIVQMSALATLPITLPAAVALLRGPDQALLRNGRIYLFLAIGIVPLVLFLFWPNSRDYLINGHYCLADYGQYVTFQGIQVGGPFGFIQRPRVIPLVVSYLLDLLGALGIGLAVFVLSRRSVSTPLRVLMVGAISQLILPIPWFCGGTVCDRYLPAIVPGLLIASLHPLLLPKPEERMPKFLPLLGMPLAVLFAFAGVSFSVEYFGYTQTRSQLYHELLASHIPPQYIDAGVENCGDTQIAIEGYINNDRIVNPHGAYHGYRQGNCMFCPAYFPAIDAHFMLTTSPTPNLTSDDTRDHLIAAPEPIAKADYFSPIGPSTRTMYVFPVHAQR